VRVSLYNFAVKVSSSDESWGSPAALKIALLLLRSPLHILLAALCPTKLALGVIARITFVTGRILQ
jgi:hypothetical protein